MYFISNVYSFYKISLKPKTNPFFDHLDRPCRVFVPQVTVHYEQKDGAVIPKRVHTIVISVQHDDGVTLEEQQRALKEKVLT